MTDQVLFATIEYTLPVDALRQLQAERVELLALLAEAREQLTQTTIEEKPHDHGASPIYLEDGNNEQADHTIAARGSDGSQRTR